MLTARKFLSLLWGLLLYATCLSAQAQVTSAGQTDERLNLLYTLTYLEDPSNRLSYEEIQHLTHQKRFKPWSGNGTALNFGLSQSDFWIRLASEKTVMHLQIGIWRSPIRCWQKSACMTLKASLFGRGSTFHFASDPVLIGISFFRFNCNRSPETSTSKSLL